MKHTSVLLVMAALALCSMARPSAAQTVVLGFDAVSAYVNGSGGADRPGLFK